MPTPEPTRHTPQRGRPVAEARKRCGLTQAALAQLVGVRRITIIRLEGGETTPSVALALAIGRELGEPVEALFGGGEC